MQKRYSSKIVKFGRLSNCLPEEMNLYPATAFIRHLLTARSAAGHGVHSPFVFDFLTDVVGGKSDAKVIGEVERLRQEMLADRRTVRVTDLGAGSARGLGEERSISDIASAAALPPRQAALLSRISGSIRKGLHRGLDYVEQSHAADAEQDFPGVPPYGITRDSQGEDKGILSKIESGNYDGRGPAISESHLTSELRGKVTGDRNDGAGSNEQGTRMQKPDSVSSGIILELGTSLGISTLALSLAAPGKRVVTVEGCPALAEIARDNLLRHGAENAEVMNMEFSEALEFLKTRGTTVSMAFIDGNHRGGALKQYAETIRSMGEEMLIVADDIHLNRDMYSAWSSLVTQGTGGRARAAKSPQGIRLPPVLSGIAPATMETFRFGILFCLHNLTPGNFRIRH